MTWIGWGLIAALAVAAILAPRAVRRILGKLGAVLDAVAKRPGAAILTCAVLSLFGSMLVARFVKWPEPLEHDEFSYLLAADTFAHGRLTNPTHPMWRHFETFHVIQEPTYASKYPPGQALALAAGQVFAGHPIAGVWLSGALMVAAICWMLFGFVPARWAFAGGLIAVARFGVASYWTQSFWGGAVAAAGGALVFGALPRLFAFARVRDAVALACGVAILANSRPFEGLIAVIPAAVVVIAWLLSGRRLLDRRVVRRTHTSLQPAPSDLLLRVVLPVFVVLGATAVWMAIYNQAVTGHVSRFPYWVYEHTYPAAPAFLFIQSAPIPPYRHEVIRLLCEKLVGPHGVQRTLAGFLEGIPRKAASFWRFFIGPWLSVALLAFPLAWRRPWMKFTAVTLFVMALGLFSETFLYMHYFAPALALLVLAVVAGLRQISALRPAGRPLGKAVAAGLVLLALLAPLDQVRLLRRPGHPEWQRARVLADLEKAGGRHLVLVRYGPDHLANVLGYEWVYNHADVDASPVVWARDMGDADNRELLAYYPDRKVALVEVGFTRGSVEVKPLAR